MDQPVRDRSLFCPDCRNRRPDLPDPQDQSKHPIEEVGVRLALRSDRSRNRFPAIQTTNSRAQYFECLLGYQQLINPDSRNNHYENISWVLARKYHAGDRGGLSGIFYVHRKGCPDHGIRIRTSPAGDRGSATQQTMQKREHREYSTEDEASATAGSSLRPDSTRHASRAHWSNVRCGVAKTPPHVICQASHEQQGGQLRPCRCHSWRFH